MRRGMFACFGLVFLILTVLLYLIKSFQSLAFLPIVVTGALVNVVRRIHTGGILSGLAVLGTPGTAMIQSNGESLVSTRRLMISSVIVFGTNTRMYTSTRIYTNRMRMGRSLLANRSSRVAGRTKSRLVSKDFVVSNRYRTELSGINRSSCVSGLALRTGRVRGNRRSRVVHSLSGLIGYINITVVPVKVMLITRSLMFRGTSFRSDIASVMTTIVKVVPRNLCLLTDITLTIDSVQLTRRGMLLRSVGYVRALTHISMLYMSGANAVARGAVGMRRLVPARRCSARGVKSLHLVIKSFISTVAGSGVAVTTVGRCFARSSNTGTVSGAKFSSTAGCDDTAFRSGACILKTPRFMLLSSCRRRGRGVARLTSANTHILMFNACTTRVSKGTLARPMAPLNCVLLTGPVHRTTGRAFRCFARRKIRIGIVSKSGPIAISGITGATNVGGTRGCISTSDLRARRSVGGTVLRGAIFKHIAPGRGERFIRTLGRTKGAITVAKSKIGSILTLGSTSYDVTVTSKDSTTTRTSRVMLLRSSFSYVPRIILRKEEMMGGVRQSTDLFLIGGVFSFLLDLFSMMFVFACPLRPSRMSLVDVFAVNVPTFFLTLRPGGGVVGKRFLAGMFLGTLPTTLASTLTIKTLIIFKGAFKMKRRSVSATTAVLLTVMKFVVLCGVDTPVGGLHTKVLNKYVTKLLFYDVCLGRLFTVAKVAAGYVVLFIMFTVTARPMLHCLAVLLKGKEFCCEHLHKGTPLRRRTWYTIGGGGTGMVVRGRGGVGVGQR